jgi:hypothetical protein
MTLRLNGSTSGYTEIDAPAVAGSNTLILPTGNGSAGNILGTDGAGNLSWVNGRMVRGTAVASTSGTSIDFTSIPSWAKRITIVFDGLSLTPGAAIYPLFQLGDSGGIENTGYSSYSTVSSKDISSGIVTIDAILNTSGFVYYWGQAASFRYGTVTFSNVDGNTWISTHVGAGAIAATAIGSTHGGGTKTLSGTLDRVRVTTTNGTDTFDAGSINILYEG